MFVAKLIAQRGRDLRRALALDVPKEELPTDWQTIVELKEEKLQLEARVLGLSAERDLAVERGQKAAKRAKAAAAAKTEVKQGERAKQKEIYQKRTVAFITAAKEKAALDLQRLAAFAEAYPASGPEAKGLYPRGLPSRLLHLFFI